MKRQVLFSMALVSALTASAQRIDFNLAGRSESQVNEPEYTAWAVNTCETESKEVEDADGNPITITLANDASYAGRRLKSCWFKNGLSSSKLIADGFAIYGYEDGNTPQVTEGAVRLNITLKGLSAGKHSLMAYHNNNDGFNAPKLDVYVNGTRQQEGIAQTNRALTPSACGMSYVTFVAEEGKDVVISYVTTPSASDDKSGNYTTSLTINALIFDRPNPQTAATDPYPENRDYHADADNGSLTISWTSAEKAVKHHVLIGTDANSLTEVATTTEAKYTINLTSNLNTYYWRIDEEDAAGNVYEGDVWSFRPRHLAFPGAEGYGKYATGGRGGSVYHVTTLEDNGDDENPIEGSFRYGIKKATGPRTIVFDVAGVIDLKKRLTCSDEYVTIAGQTAPGNGIMLRGCPFGMASEGITRFLRMRLGHKETNGGTISDEDKVNGLDGMGMAGNDNAIMDHCSISWTIDEAFSSRNAKSLTLQRTLISEALNVAGHPNYSAGTAHGYAATIGGGEMSATLKVGSYHHNLLAHCEGRNWSLSGGLDGVGAYDGHHDVFNNVVYNWGGRATDGGSHEVNFVNNYYKMGPATTQKKLFRLQLEGTGSGTQSAYVHGNIRQAAGNGALTEDKLKDTYVVETSNGQVVNWEPFVSKPFFESLAAIESAKAAYKNVLCDVGANQPFLDNHDTRMVNETLAGTTTTVGSQSGKKGLIDSEEDKGCEGFKGLNITEAKRDANWDTDQDGMPDWWEEVKGVSDGNADENADGYTNLEEYLNWLAEPHFTLKQGESVTIDMKKYFAGYTNNPQFECEAKGDAMSKMSHDTGANEGEYIFTANEDCGKALVDYTVKVSDDDNISTYTRTFHFYLTDGSATGIQNIQSSTAADSYEVYNAAGIKVRKSKNLDSLPSGVYIIKALKDGKVISSKKTCIQ